MGSLVSANEKVFIGPGLSLFKRIITYIGITGAMALVIWIAYRQGPSASVIGSTVVALLFILGFAYYLRLVAPIPFTITIEPAALVKSNKKGEIITVNWENLTRIKEEFFPNGKRIGITAYRQPSSPQEKPKAWSVYRDDVTDIDAFAEALKASIPSTCTWQSETVHE